MNIGIVKSFVAGGAIGQNTFVEFSADYTVTQANAATDLIVGVCVQPGGALQGERVDIQLTGIAEVKAGGTITRGTLVTTDSNGKAVAPGPSAGVNNRVAGMAMITTADGDLFDVLLAPGMIQGA